MKQELFCMLNRMGIRHDYTTTQDGHSVCSIRIDNNKFDVLKKELSSAGFIACKKIPESSNTRDCTFIGYDETDDALFLVFIKDGKSEDNTSQSNISSYFKLDYGMTIAFLGQDGSGKSTVTNIIMEWLKPYFKTSYYYLGSGEKFNPWEKRLNSFLNKLNLPFRKFLSLFLLIRVYYKLSDSTVKIVGKAKEQAYQGCFALFDRYPQTQYPGINDGPKISVKILNKLPLKFLRCLFVKYSNREEENLRIAELNHPDLIFKLLLPPEESIRRKPDCTLDNIVLKHNVVKSVKYSGAKIYEISADQDFNEEIKQIKSHIWENIKERNCTTVV